MHERKDVASRLKQALENRSLTALTRAISDLADELAYQLLQPHTEILHLKAKEENERYTIDFAAKLYLHYSSLQRNGEGLIFTVKFQGEALSDSPSPPIHELFYAARVESLSIYAYGDRWKGENKPTPNELEKSLGIKLNYLVEIQVENFYSML